MSNYQHLKNIPMKNTKQNIFTRRRARYQPDDIVYVTGTAYNSSTRSTEHSNNKKGKIINVNKPWDQEFGIYGVRFDDGSIGSDIHENSISRYDSVFSIGDNVIDIVTELHAIIIDSYVKNNKYHHLIKFDDGSIKEDIPSENLKKCISTQNKVNAKVGDSITINVYDKNTPNLIKKMIGRVIETTNTSYKIMTDKFTRNMSRNDLDETDQHPDGFISNIENGDVVYVTGTITQIYPTNTTITVNEKEGRIIDSSWNSNIVMFMDGTRGINIQNDKVHLYKNGDNISAFLNSTNNYSSNSSTSTSIAPPEPSDSEKTLNNLLNILAQETDDSNKINWINLINNHLKNYTPTPVKPTRPVAPNGSINKYRCPIEFTISSDTPPSSPPSSHPVNHFPMIVGGVGFGPLPGFVTAGPFGLVIHSNG